MKSCLYVLINIYICIGNEKKEMNQYQKHDFKIYLSSRPKFLEPILSNSRESSSIKPFHPEILNTHINKKINKNVQRYIITNNKIKPNEKKLYKTLT